MSLHLAPRHDLRRQAPPQPTPNASAAREPEVWVVYATRGRASLLPDAVEWLKRQSLQPASIILSCATPEDAGTLVDRPGVRIVFGPPGSAAQRNTALRQIPPTADIVVFFDDDFVPHPRWLETVARTFHERPDVVAVTGNVIADGIKGPGLTFAQACGRLAACPAEGGPDRIENPYSPYGCNMAFRRAAIADLAFDERLVLYGWLEDRDFGAMLTRRGGTTVKVGAALGVHLGVKRGRIAGVRLGYSQVVNPFYLRRKGHMSLFQVADHLFRNMASNAVRSFAPEAYVDRRGRLRGNLIGLRDVLRGRFTPERAEHL